MGKDKGYSRGILTKYARSLIQERVDHAIQCCMTEKDQERIRFLVRIEELVKIYTHCLETDRTVSNFCRNAVMDRLYEELATDGSIDTKITSSIEFLVGHGYTIEKVKK